MKYFANYEADAVIREDEHGQRFAKKYIVARNEFTLEGKASPDDKEVWGIPSYGVYNFLEPITKEEYDNYGVTWDWSPYGEKRDLTKL